MALKDMLLALEEEGRLQESEIEESARKQAAEILKAAKANAEQVREVFAEKTQKETENQTAKIIAEAKLTVDKTVGKTKEEQIETVFAKAVAGIGDQRKSPEYPAVFKALAREALGQTEGDMVLKGNPADRKLAEALMEEIPGFRFEPVDSITGGAIVTSSEDRVTINNSLESRVELAGRYLRSDVARILFQ